MKHPISLCYASASPFCVPFPIDFSCAILKVFFIEDLPSRLIKNIMYVINDDGIDISICGKNMH